MRSATSDLHVATADEQAQLSRLGAYSGPSRAQIPAEAEHEFRGKVSSDSGHAEQAFRGWRARIPVMSNMA